MGANQDLIWLRDDLGVTIVGWRWCNTTAGEGEKLHATSDAQAAGLWREGGTRNYRGGSLAARQLEVLLDDLAASVTRLAANLRIPVALERAPLLNQASCRCCRFVPRMIETTAKVAIPWRALTSDGSKVSCGGSHVDGNSQFCPDPLPVCFKDSVKDVVFQEASSPVLVCDSFDRKCDHYPVSR